MLGFVWDARRIIFPDAPQRLRRIGRDVMEEVGIGEALVWHADAQFSDSQAGNATLLADIVGLSMFAPVLGFSSARNR